MVPWWVDIKYIWHICHSFPILFSKALGALVNRQQQTTKMLGGFLELHGEHINSCDVTCGNEHVCFATPRMRELTRGTFGEENHVMNFSNTYVLCRTLPDYIHGFNLLESRVVSCHTPECPLVLLTLYRRGTVDGVVEHMKHLTVICSPSGKKIRVPKVRKEKCYIY